MEKINPRLLYAVYERRPDKPTDKLLGYYHGNSLLSDTCRHMLTDSRYLVAKVNKFPAWLQDMEAQHNKVPKGITK